MIQNDNYLHCSTQLDGQPTNGDVVITPTTETQISTISNGSTNKLFQTQISVASNNTHLHEGIHNHDSQEPISKIYIFIMRYSMCHSSSGKRSIGKASHKLYI